MRTITLETDDPKILETLTWLDKRFGVKIYPDTRENPLKENDIFYFHITLSV